MGHFWGSGPLCVKDSKVLEWGKPVLETLAQQPGSVVHSTNDGTLSVLTARWENQPHAQSYDELSSSELLTERKRDKRSPHKRAMLNRRHSPDGLLCSPF